MIDDDRRRSLFTPTKITLYIIGVSMSGFPHPSAHSQLVLRSGPKSRITHVLWMCQFHGSVWLCHRDLFAWVKHTARTREGSLCVHMGFVLLFERLPNPSARILAVGIKCCIIKIGINKQVRPTRMYHGLSDTSNSSLSMLTKKTAIRVKYVACRYWLHDLLRPLLRRAPFALFPWSLDAAMPINDAV